MHIVCTNAYSMHEFLAKIPADNYMFKVNNKNTRGSKVNNRSTRKKYEIFLKLPIKLVNFEHISHVFLVFLMLL